MIWVYHYFRKHPFSGGVVASSSFFSWWSPSAFGPPTWHASTWGYRRCFRMDITWTTWCPGDTWGGWECTGSGGCSSQWPLTAFIWRASVPETNIAPENGRLEKEIPIGNRHFKGRAVSFRGYNPSICRTWKIETLIFHGFVSTPQPGGQWQINTSSHQSCFNDEHIRTQQKKTPNMDVLPLLFVGPKRFWESNRKSTSKYAAQKQKESSAARRSPEWKGSRAQNL